MSAIWGILSATKKIPENIDSVMSDPYRKKCRIDRFACKSTDFFYTGCGLQVISKYADRERLPIYEENVGVERPEEEKSEKEKAGVILNADCILDNREELLQELNIEDSTTPDGDILYLAYLKWGIDFLKHLLGIYSIAIWDERIQTLFLITDPTASRVLHYCQFQDMVLFSTLIEPIRAITKSGINRDYLYDYLLAPGLMPNLSATETAYEGIYKLEPGTYLKCSLSELKIVTEPVRYFRLDATHSYVDSYIDSGSDSHTGSNKLGEEFVALYRQCVETALSKDGKNAIAMSSGLDSASIAALASDLLAEKGESLYAYTYVPELTVKGTGNVVMDETEDVKKIIAMHPNICPHFMNNQGKNCLEDLENILDTLEMPIKAFTNLPNLCEIYDAAYKEGCRTLLTGQFGNSTVSVGLIDDVLFDLYKNRKYFTFLNWLNRYAKHVKESRKKALSGCIHYFRYAKELKQSKADPFANYRADNRFLQAEMTDKLAAEGYCLRERLAISGIPTLEQIPTDSDDYHIGLLRTAPFSFIGDYETKLGLKYGIVLRDPTRDIRMLRFCYLLPYKYFAYGGTPRWLIRNNMRHLLPPALLDNWMRYGMQNADYFKRIQRDKEEVKEILSKMIAEATSVTGNAEISRENGTELSELINLEKMQEFLTALEQGDITEDDFSLDYLVFCVIFLRFAIHNLQTK